MSVGYSVDKFQIDSNAGALAREIEIWQSKVLDFKQYLDGAPNEDLETLGYTAEDVALLKSSFNDLALLADLYLGNATLDPARDLGVFARRLAGLVLS
jgi:hypothetical protein